MKKSLLFITRAALIAAIYFALSTAFQAISFGPIQFRVSEALVLLPVLMPEAIPGLVIGCFFSNFINSPYIFDMLFGTLGTLIGAVGTYLLRKKIVLSALPPIIANALLVPVIFVLSEVPDTIYYIAALEIAASEVIICGIIGIPFTLVLKKALLAAKVINPAGSKYQTQPYRFIKSRSEDTENSDFIDTDDDLTDGDGNLADGEDNITDTASSD